MVSFIVDSWRRGIGSLGDDGHLRPSYIGLISNFTPSSEVLRRLLKNNHDENSKIAQFSCEETKVCME